MIATRSANSNQIEHTAKENMKPPSATSTAAGTPAINKLTRRNFQK